MKFRIRILAGSDARSALARRDTEQAKTKFEPRTLPGKYLEGA